MGEKFDRLTGNFKVAIQGKEYPFSMTLRQRGIYNNLRMKMDQEAIIMFLFERFKEGFLNANRGLGKDTNQGEMDAYEEELNKVFIVNYETITTEVMVALGIVTREQLAKAQKDMEGQDFLESWLTAKLGEKKAQA